MIFVAHFAKKNVTLQTYLPNYNATKNEQIH